MSDDYGVKPDPGSPGPREGALDLDALSAMCDAATPGPWVWNEGGDVIDSISVFDNVYEPTHDREPRVIVFGVAELPADTTFIAAAREAMPALIERVRLAERERDEANARAATILQETAATLRDVRAEYDEALRERNGIIDERNTALNRAAQAERERDELRAAVERVRALYADDRSMIASGLVGKSKWHIENALGEQTEGA